MGAHNCAAYIVFSIATITGVEEPASQTLSPKLEPFRWMIGRWEPVERQSISRDFNGWEYNVNNWYWSRNMKPDSLHVKPGKDGQSIEWTYKANKEQLLQTEISFKVTERLSWDSDNNCYRLDIALDAGTLPEWAETLYANKLTRYLKKDGRAYDPSKRPEKSASDERELWKTQIKKLGEDSFEKSGFGDSNLPFTVPLGIPGVSKKDYSDVVGHMLKIRFKRVE